MNKILKGIIPAGHIHIRESILEKGNVFGIAGDKSAWAKGLDLPRKAEYTFFAGCTYQFMKYGAGMSEAVRVLGKAGLGMDKALGLARGFKKVGIDLTDMAGKVMTAGREDLYTGMLICAVSSLKKLGVDIGYLYEQEPCCGSPLYYSGFWDDYARNARQNCGLFQSLGVKKMVSLVPACTASLKNLYPRFVDGYGLEVKHYTQVAAERLRETDIKPELKEKLVATYHDPCQLSRYLGIIDEPREIMARIDGLELREVGPHFRGEWSTCCGGGGGMEISAPELSQRVAVRRVKELLDTGASVIITSCPACVMQLIKGAANLKADVQIFDLAQVLDKALE